MMHTDPELLDRLVEKPPPAKERCDSCLMPLDPNVDGTRFRHAGCDAPTAVAEHVAEIKLVLAARRCKR